MQIKKSLAIFDFCDTVFDGQSINYFLNFLNFKLPIYKKIYSKLRNRLNRISSSDSKRYKEYLLEVYKNISKSKFDIYSKEFYEMIIKTRLHNMVIDKLKEHQKQGYIIVIISGGFENYLKYFVEEYKIDFLFCTKLEFIDDKFTSKIDGVECLGLEKVNQLRKLDLTKYDLENSYVYSDHHSDKPLFDLVTNKIVVKSKQNLDWIDERYDILDVNKKVKICVE